MSGEAGPDDITQLASGPVAEGLMAIVQLAQEVEEAARQFRLQATGRESDEATREIQARFERVAAALGAATQELVGFRDDVAQIVTRRMLDG